MAYSITHMALLQALTSILLFASSFILLVVQAGSAAESTTSSAGTYRFELTHVDANRGFTREELIQRSEARAKLRAAMLSSDDSGSNTHAKYIASARYAPQEYLMELQIGTPPQKQKGQPLLTFKAVADTGSDLVWTRKLDNCRCQASSTFKHWSCSHPDVYRNPYHGTAPCDRCNDEKRTAAAEEYSCSGPCMFKKRYGGGNISGFMATEKLTLRAAGETTVSLDLGCAVDWRDKMLPDSADGIAGLNRGPYSLVNQLEAKKFAYCLSDRLDENAPSSQLLFYDDKSDLELISDPQSLQTTSLVDAVDEKNKPVGSFMYHVQLDGISIGDNMKHKSLPEKSFIRKSAAKSGGPANVKPAKPKPKGVMFVDSGASQTILEKGVFDRLIELLKDEHGPLEAVTYKKKNCFRLKDDGSEWPEMALYFPGAEMRLPRANYMSETQAAGQKVFCLTIREDANQSILGNFQLQNMHMLFDLTNEKLQFALHKDCSGLAVKEIKGQH